MAKTIAQLTALAATPDAADEFVISDGGVTKKITATNVAAAAWELTGNKSLADAANIVLGTTTGSKIGTATTQKLGFWNATPIVQPAAAAQAALTNSTGGTADGTLAAVSGTGDDTDINNNFTELHTLLNAIRTALVNSGIMKGAA
jgi:hypothetical protein